MPISPSSPIRATSFLGVAGLACRSRAAIGFNFALGEVPTHGDQDRLLFFGQSDPVVSIARRGGLSFELGGPFFHERGHALGLVGADSNSSGERLLLEDVGLPAAPCWRRRG